MTDREAFLLQRVQPAMVGLIDGSLSTLAPIFSVAVVTHKPHYAFIAGLATAFGAGISMAFSEGLSDTGELTGRGNPIVRGGITGAGPLPRWRLPRLPGTTALRGVPNRPCHGPAAADPAEQDDCLCNIEQAPSGDGDDPQGNGRTKIASRIAPRRSIPPFLLGGG